MEYHEFSGIYGYNVNKHELWFINEICTLSCISTYVRQISINISKSNTNNRQIHQSYQFRQLISKHLNELLTFG